MHFPLVHSATSSLFNYNLYLLLFKVLCKPNLKTNVIICGAVRAYCYFVTCNISDSTLRQHESVLRAMSIFGMGVDFLHVRGNSVPVCREAEQRAPTPAGSSQLEIVPAASMVQGGISQIGPEPGARNIYQLAGNDDATPKLFGTLEEMGVGERSVCTSHSSFIVSCE